MKKIALPGANLISRARALFTPDVKKSVFDDRAFFGSSNISANKFNTKGQQLGAYEQIAWVSIAVDCLTRDGGSQEFYFINEDTKKVIDTKQLPPNLITPFKNGFPAARMPFSGGLMPMMIAHRAITGNSYFLMTSATAFGATSDIVEQFIPLNPANVKTIIADDGLSVLRYELDIGSRCLSIPPEYILHFKQSCIQTPFSGTGSITKMRLTAEGEASSDEFNNEFMKRRATPSIFIKDEESRNSDEFKRTLELLRQNYEGLENSGRLLFMSGKGVDAKTLQLSQKDIQFLETKQFNRQTILSVFGVPPSVAGIPDGMNYASATAFKLNYYESTINPMLKEIESYINLGFMQKRFPGILFQFKKFNTGDIALVKEELANGIITPNRAAEKMGETADYGDEGRDSYYLPSNLMPISGVIPAAPVAPAPAPVEPAKFIINRMQGKTAEEIQTMIQNPDNVDAICEYYEKKLPTSRRYQVQFLRMALLRRKVLTKKYETKLGQFFNEQGKRVIKNAEVFIKNNPKAMKIDPSKMVSFVFNLDEENGELEDVTSPLHTAAVTGAVSDINGLTNGTVQSSMANPWVKKAVQRCGVMLVKTHALNEVTQAKLQEMIAAWLVSDGNIVSLTDSLSSLFDGYEGWRARRIARTESRYAWDQGAAVNYKDQGVDTVDVVGCEQFENDSDCGRTGIPIDLADTLSFHPNHIGAIVPAEKTGLPSDTPTPDDAQAI